MRQVNALTMRSELSRSRIKKKSALPREKKINANKTQTITLIMSVIVIRIRPLKLTLRKAPALAPQV